MKKIFAFILGIFSMVSGAQQTNPQTNFPATVMAAKPSLYLNFNDLTTGFTDKISGSAFFGNYSASSSYPTSLTEVLTGATATGTTYLGNYSPGFPSPGFLSSVMVCFTTAPASNQPLDILIGASHAVAAIIPVTGIATVSGCQTLVSGTNFSGINVTAGQQIGVYAASGLGVAHEVSSGSDVGVYCSGAPTVGGSAGCDFIETPIDIEAFITTTYTSGTVTPRQPGFDSTTPDNTSAAFPYNGFNMAPNNTLGAIDWDVPFSLLVHVDQLNWNRTGSLVLMSKGDLSGGSNPYWELYLQMSGSESQLCFREGSPGVEGVSGQVGGICTSGIDAMPNGFNYDIVITNNGTGSPGFGGIPNAIGMYLNGLEVGGTGNYIPASNVSPYGSSLGALVFTVSGGTGYAATTPVTITGGGANCTLTGYVMDATSGIPTSITNPNSGDLNFGCTSVPTVSLTSPTGTGVTITATPIAQTMNSTAYPLLVPGYVSSEVYYGVAGANSAAAATYVDEAAIFPGVLTPTQIGALFYQTKFYQGLLTKPAVPPVVVFDDDGATDQDNLWALQEAIALHKLGYINLEGVIQENNDSPQTNLAFYRQELDQAGLANVPVGLPSDAGDYTGYNITGINTFNASTLTLVTYPTAAQVYRQVFAANPGAPVSIMIGAELNGLANFMQSPADSISALTGAQLFARNAANGGVLYSQGGGCGSTGLPASTPCTGSIGAQYGNTTSYTDAAYVYANGTAMPMIAVGGTPLSAGPGPLATRTSKDPAYLQMLLLYDTDVRTAYDSLPMSALVTPYFYGGINVGYSSGGTGYAATTLFTSTGGGPNCNVTGYMTASGGVPNGITTLWGYSAAGSFEGFGYGCTSAPTLNLVSPTGTGATLTAYALDVCGTASFPGYASGQSFASGTCSNQYITPMSLWATPSSNAPVFTWFLNSLVDAPPGGAQRLK